MKKNNENKTSTLKEQKAIIRREKIRKQLESFNFKGLLVDIMFIVLGTFIMGLGYKTFLSPHNIVPGGFMGVAQILYDLLAKIGFTAISVSLWYIILNFFLFCFAVKTMGIKFGIKAGVGIGAYSLFVAILENSTIIDAINNQFILEDEALFGVGLYILYALYGGVLMGAGMGLVLRSNGSTGGCDLVAMVVNKFFPTITTGQIVLAVDGAVVILSAIAYSSLILPLYALIAIYVCSKVADMFIDGVKSLRAFYIITDKKDEMSKMIFDYVGRGVTDIKCEGMYTHKDRDMLMVIVRRAQVYKLKEVVKKVDEDSFMFSATVKEVYGKGFLSYSTINKKRKNDLNSKGEKSE